MPGCVFEMADYTDSIKKKLDSVKGELEEVKNQLKEIQKQQDKKRLKEFLSKTVGAIVIL